VRERYMERMKVIVKQRNENLVMGPIGGAAPSRTGRQTVGRNVT
jgi:hypothetical protein